MHISGFVVSLCYGWFQTQSRSSWIKAKSECWIMEKSNRSRVYCVRSRFSCFSPAPTLSKVTTSIELVRYQRVLRDRQPTFSPDETNTTVDLVVEKLRMTPLIRWEVKEHLHARSRVAVPSASSHLRDKPMSAVGFQVSGCRESF